MKKEFLAVYDYGTGGARACLLADLAARSTNASPSSTSSPTGRTGSPTRKTGTARADAIDIDDTENRFLAALLQQRNRSPIHRS
jgi:hypothetical protein